MQKHLRLPNSLEKELRKINTRQGRKKADFYVVEGEKCCREALNWSPGVRYAVYAEGCQVLQHDFPAYVVAKKLFDELSLTENSQGMMFIVAKPVFNEARLIDPYLLVLDGLQEPGNMGTILRTAVAVGLQEVALIHGTVDPFNAKAIRAGMGAQFRLSFSFYDSLGDLINKTKASDRQVWLTSPHEGLSCYDSSFVLKDSLLVFGEEGGGIRDFSIGQKTTIPMPGEVESLNVAQAVTLYLFEGVRQGLF